MVKITIRRLSEELKEHEDWKRISSPHLLKPIETPSFHPQFRVDAKGDTYHRYPAKEEFLSKERERPNDERANLEHKPRRQDSCRDSVIHSSFAPKTRLKVKDVTVRARIKGGIDVAQCHGTPTVATASLSISKPLGKHAADDGTLHASANVLVEGALDYNGGSKSIEGEATNLDLQNPVTPSCMYEGVHSHGQDIKQESDSTVVGVHGSVSLHCDFSTGVEASNVGVEENGNRLGTSIGIGEKVSRGDGRVQVERGFHASYRIPELWKLVGARACVGTVSDHTRRNESLDDSDLRSFACGSKNDGVLAKADCLGITCAEASVGALDKSESFVSHRSESSEFQARRHVSGLACDSKLKDHLTATMCIGDGTTCVAKTRRTSHGLCHDFVEKDVKGVLSSVRLRGFGGVDFDTGFTHATYVAEGSKSRGKMFCGRSRQWRTHRETFGCQVLGVALEVPWNWDSSSNDSMSFCGFEFFSVIHECHGLLLPSETETSTFFLLLEVQSESAAWDKLIGRPARIKICGTDEFAAIWGRATASAVADFFCRLRAGKSTACALRSSCKVFSSMLVLASTDTFLTAIASKVATAFQKKLTILTDAPPAFRAIAPFLSDGVGSLVRPVVEALVKRECSIQSLGGAWFKQFTLLQLLKMLRDAGMAHSTLQAVTASYSVLFDKFASGNPDPVKLLIELVPVLLIEAAKITCTGNYSWVVAYIVVPVLVELIRDKSVQVLLGQVLASVVSSANSLSSWVLAALARLQKFFQEIGVAGTAVGLAFSGAGAVAAAGAATAALTPAATLCGSATLGSVAVSIGVMAAPVAPAGAVLAAASVGGFVTGAVAMYGCRSARRVLSSEKEVQVVSSEKEVIDWRCALAKGSVVEVFVKRPRRQWRLGVIWKTISTRLSTILCVKFCREDGSIEYLRLDRFSDYVRLPGHDSATEAFVRTSA